MTRPYKLRTLAPLAPTDVLHWSNFWPDLQRIHQGSVEARQDLILWLANLYEGTIKCGKPLGFCTVQISLMELREWVRDYRPALDYFFDIKQLGFRVNEDNTELTTLVPKKLVSSEAATVKQITKDLQYFPPTRPDNAIISKVYIRQNLDIEKLTAKLISIGRPEIIPQLVWLLKQPSEINFHFIPSGKLKLRDTSVWPISGVETWPSWLREELFGPGIDLDSAYVQFLLHYVNKTYSGEEHRVKILYPDLIRLLYDKEAFREQLCTQVLHQPYNDKYKSVIKQILMSLANGSRISATLLTNGSGFSLTSDIILDAAPNISASDLKIIGDRLQIIARQFVSAKKQVCLTLQRQAPNRQNVKKVFSSYFAWERKARYAIWKEVDCHGIMVHDGLDGVPQEYLNRLPIIMERLQLLLTT